MGYFVLVYFLEKSISKYSGRYFGLKTVFEIVCYASVVCIPIVIISEISFYIYNFKLSTFITENIGNFFAGDSSSVMPEHGSETLFSLFIGELFVFVFIFWWIYILNFALKVFGVENRAKILGRGFGLYFLVKIIGILILTFFAYLPSFNDLYWLAKMKTTKESKSDIPNYFLSRTIFDSVAHDKVIPSKTRFQFKLLSVACSLEMLKPIECEKLPTETEAFLRINENGTAYDTLNTQIEKLNNGEYDDMYLN